MRSLQAGDSGVFCQVSRKLPELTGMRRGGGRRKGVRIFVFIHTEILEFKGNFEVDAFVDVLGKWYLREGGSQ
jgi:hypothetical protein